MVNFLQCIFFLLDRQSKYDKLNYFMNYKFFLLILFSFFLYHCGGNDDSSSGPPMTTDPPPNLNNLPTITAEASYTLLQEKDNVFTATVNDVDKDALNWRAQSSDDHLRVNPDKGQIASGEGTIRFTLTAMPELDFNAQISLTVNDGEDTATHKVTVIVNTRLLIEKFDARVDQDKLKLKWKDPPGDRLREVILSWQPGDNQASVSAGVEQFNINGYSGDTGYTITVSTKDIYDIISDEQTFQWDTLHLPQENQDRIQFQPKNFGQIQKHAIKANYTEFCEIINTETYRFKISGEFNIPKGTRNFQLTISAGPISSSFDSYFISLIDPSGSDLVTEYRQQQAQPRESLFSNHRLNLIIEEKPTNGILYLATLHTTDTSFTPEQVNMAGKWTFTISQQYRFPHERITFPFVSLCDNRDKLEKERPPLLAMLGFKAYNDPNDRLNVHPIVLGEHDSATVDIITQNLQKVVDVFRNVGLNAELVAPTFTQSESPYQTYTTKGSDFLNALNEIVWEHSIEDAINVLVVGPKGTLGNGIGGVSSIGGTWAIKSNDAYNLPRAIYLTDFNDSRTARVIAHEILHNLGLGHPVEFHSTEHWP